jgi:hypothetical protein
MDQLSGFWLLRKPQGARGFPGTERLAPLVFRGHARGARVTLAARFTRPLASLQCLLRPQKSKISDGLRESSALADAQGPPTTGRAKLSRAHGAQRRERPAPFAVPPNRTSILPNLLRCSGSLRSPLAARPSHATRVLALPSEQAPTTFASRCSAHTRETRATAPPAGFWPAQQLPGWGSGRGLPWVVIKPPGPPQNPAHSRSRRIKS